MDPFIGVWWYFLMAPRAFGWGFLQAAMVHQALLQQEDPQRLLEAEQGGGADQGWIQLLQVLMVVAHVLPTQPASIISVQPSFSLLQNRGHTIVQQLLLGRRSLTTAACRLQLFRRESSEERVLDLIQRWEGDSETAVMGSGELKGAFWPLGDTMIGKHWHVATTATVKHSNI